MSATAPALRQGPTKLIWLVPLGAFMILVAPVVLLAGAGNPPCPAAVAASTPTGVADAGMFAAPLQLQAGRWYRVGATEYGNPGSGSGLYGSSGAYLPANPDSFAELSLLDSNPANGGTFTFQDANALDNLPYGTAIRVAGNGAQAVLYKRDIGYGQGPGQSITYRIDIWYQAAAQLGISKNPVDIELAPASGTAATLGQLPGATAGGGAAPSLACDATYTGPLPLTAGQQATILPSGLAAAPRNAPAAVKLAIAAGNEIIDKPYIWGGGHGQALTQIASSYDCSGATSFVLHAAGIFGDYAEDATELESYGQAGPGNWITVYANSTHAFIDIAGIVLDTAWYAPVNPTTPGSGPRWQPASIIAAQYAGDLADGHGGFIQRHPGSL